MCEMLHRVIEEKSFPWRGCGGGLQHAGPSSLLNKFFNHCVILGFFFMLDVYEEIVEVTFLLYSQEKTKVCHSIGLNAGLQCEL